MSSFKNASIGKKVFMGLTGLFLCIFLVGHLAGNLQLLLPAGEAKDLFNEYALFMTTNPAVKVLSYLTYFSILFHTIQGIRLSLQNKAARPVAYAKNNAAANSVWSSRNMGILGTIILVFIVTHLQNFWYQMHYGSIPTYTTESGMLVKDLYTVVITFFTHGTWGLVACVGYVIAMIALGFHLWHGFQSGFQTLGLHHEKHTKMIQKAGKAFAVVVPLLFAIIPILIYIR